MATRKKPAVNLSLSKDVQRKAAELMRREFRSSVSNLVESLILREHQRLLPKKSEEVQSQG